MKLSDIMILAALALFACLAVRVIVARRKQGGCVGCSGCPMAGSCSKEDKTNE